MNNNNLNIFKQYSLLSKKYLVFKVLLATFKTSYYDFLEMPHLPQKKQTVSSLIVDQDLAILFYCFKNTEKYSIAHP